MGLESSKYFIFSVTHGAPIGCNPDVEDRSLLPFAVYMLPNSVQPPVVSTGSHPLTHLSIGHLRSLVLLFPLLSGPGRSPCSETSRSSPTGTTGCRPATLSLVHLRVTLSSSSRTGTSRWTPSNGPSSSAPGVTLTPMRVPSCTHWAVACPSP